MTSCAKAFASTSEVLVGDAADTAPDVLSFKALLISRAALFGLFHKLLGGLPDRASVEELLSDSVLDMVDEYAEDETMRGLGAFLAQLRTHDSAEFLEAARDEYTRTFLGPAELPAPPTEAPYLTHDAAVFQESTLAVRAWYRRFSMLPRRYLRVPDDHVAIMCDFMAQMADTSLRRASEGKVCELVDSFAAQRSFASSHMMTWLPEYAKALRRSRTAVVYPQLAEALSAFVRLDVAFCASAEEWLSQAGDAVFGEAAVEPPAFVRARETLFRIRSLHPFGIEDNELVPEGEVSGHDAAQSAFVCS